MFAPDTCCTIAPYFEIHEGQGAAFKALALRFVEQARSERGCVHYTFSFSGNLAHCREGYDDAQAILDHLQSIRELLDEALKLAAITRLEIHAPASEIELLRAPLAALNPQFFMLEPGIRRVG
jgi:quinol monooxygenase YgiN